MPTYPVKAWSRFLSVSENKTEIVKFLVSEWKKLSFMDKLFNKILYVTENKLCWKLDMFGNELVPELESTHEEADTRIVLHAKHAQGNVVVHADDTDVFVLLLSHSRSLGNTYMKMGRGIKSRIVDLQNIATHLKSQLNSNVDFSDFLLSLLGIHAFTGCDSVSAFSGKGKTKSLTLLMKNTSYINVFKSLGITWSITDEYENQVEKFLCELYGKETTDINALRYQLYCSKGGKVEPEGLPPCKSNLSLHIKRANYQTAIWRRAIVAQPNLPSPDGHGWIVCDKEITINWMATKPAPNEILELLSCGCRKSCIASKCCCMKAGLPCTDMCFLKCDNFNVESMDTDTSDDSDED